MSLEQQEALIVKLGDGGDSIPGLEIEPVIENITEKSEELKGYTKVVDEEVQENIDRGMSPDDARKEAAEKTEEITTEFKESIKQAVSEKITIIKQEYKVIQDGLIRIPEDVTGIIANILLPPAIAAPAAAPNPVYALNLAKSSKNILSGLLNTIATAFTAMLQAANQILFVLPAPVLLLAEQLAILKTLVDSIPV